MKNKEKELCRQDHLDLEAYRTLQGNIDQDANLGKMFERIMFPLIVAAPIVAFQFLKNGKQVIIGGVFLIVILFIRAIRSEIRTRIRFDRMREIECNLGFRAHLEVNEKLRKSKLRWFRDTYLNYLFYVAMIVIYILLCFDILVLDFIEKQQQSINR